FGDDEGSALSGGGRGSGGGPSADSRAEAPPTTTTRVEVVSRLSKGRFNPEAIYKTEAPGVVTVVSVFGTGNLDDLIGRGEGGGGGGGLGSGFVLNGKGEIATNAHVVTQGEGKATKRARQVFVEFADGNQVEAKIIGADPNADIALLRIDPSGLDLHPLPLAEDEEITVGSPVAALGSPFGERQSLSVGVVSATDRSIASLTNFQISGALQTDAAINPGNSGGPLLNADGEVIGVNQQIKTNSGGGEGVGFAVPVGMVRRSLAQLREDGSADYAYLGVSSVELYPQLVEEFDLPVQKGAWLQEITPDGPAANADLDGGGPERPFQARRYRTGGDILTRVGDTVIEDPDDLSTAISRYKPGEKVTLQVYRDGEPRRVEVTLGERPLSPPQG
ncbi:MAG: trypsin-like peptidase domain-containing protein, partial [Actinomycetota bacterium]|nr:trypsin-like peptidase domain-containing protein [Actinomycetota bacterium]